MLPTETYLPDERYYFAVDFITKAVRRPIGDDRYDRLHAALRCAGIDMGEAEFVDGMIRPSRRADLVDTFMALETDPGTGQYEHDQVKFVLGEEANVWPEYIRDDVPKNLRIAS